ncbi:MAG: hypothetical protein GBAus27B_000190 [Mycoplasmataceae bacterium]|nr:MAG: hypothetical protein GBAus27B_000190 [Mycoplasmataceae bacterium]
MTKNNENNKENFLYSWANGRIASIALGLAVVYFIHKTKMINKALGFFKKDKGKRTDSYQPDTGTSAVK